MTTAGGHEAFDAVRRAGADAVSFQSLESGMQWWHDRPPPSGSGASVAFVDTGRSWIAVGRPLAGEGALAPAVARFSADARARHRRPVFFGVEDLDGFDGHRHLTVGLQPILLPARWTATLRASPKLREQIRRSRAKGVTVRLVEPDELRERAPLRRAVEDLRAQWLGSRRMEPMGFLVAVEPFHYPAAHVYIAAEREGRLVQFLSAVPIPARGAWLLEDMLRGPAAPNGTTELVLDLLMRHVAPAAPWVTPGLTPLAGPVPWWLRLAGVVMSPFYDFAGLERFRARLSPPRWVPVWMVWDRGPAPLVIVDVLRAFAGGRLVAFFLRSTARHPGGPPWAVGVPLVAWTALLAAMAAGGGAGVLGFSRTALWGWVGFDVVMAVVLFRAARRPRMDRLGLAAVLAGADAVLSLRHLAGTGLGAGALAATLRLVATMGPLIGVAALLWAMSRARRPSTG